MVFLTSGSIGKLVAFYDIEDDEDTADDALIAHIEIYQPIPGDMMRFDLVLAGLPPDFLFLKLQQTHSVCSV